MTDMEQEFVEIEGIKHPVHVEERDVKISSTRISEGKLMIVLSSRLNEMEKKKVIENFKRRVQKPRRKRFIEPVREFNDGDIIDIGSRKYNVKIDYVNKKSSSGRLVGNTIHLLISANIPDEYKKRHAYEIVRKMLSEARLPALRSKLKELNKSHFNAKFKDVRWKKQLSQWGSCSENKYINISYRLLFAPQDVLEYVCIHELAHLIEFNHSKRFWKLVSSAMPDYEEKEKWLKENGGTIF